MTRKGLEPCRGFAIGRAAESELWLEMAARIIGSTFAARRARRSTSENACERKERGWRAAVAPTAVERLCLLLCRCYQRRLKVPTGIL
jgi:hypothetical protein